ncbi:MAG: putative lipid II flippase FtsW [Candidatus Paceibacterota bacterium]
MKHALKIDRFFLGVTIVLLLVGVAMFVSATLGELPKSARTFYAILTGQFMGLALGVFGMYVTYRIDYKFWRKNAFWILLGSVLLTAAVFIPGLAPERGGAQRWIDFGPVSFQPAEILKFGFIIYFAAWLSWAKHKVQDFRFGILPFVVLLAIIAFVLLKQPDTKNFLLISFTGLCMLFVSGVRLKYVLGIGVLAGIMLGILVFFTPYLQKRIHTFINPAADARGASYQVQQSMIAIGSGGMFGRGYGQSIQKFSYLPEPQGDSIFAVVGEELGFVGSSIVILLYVIFVLKGLRISHRAPDHFSRLLVFGIVILIGAQSFLHIASVVGVFPLTGVPLVFMSHGGTSLMIYLLAVGVVLQISKYQIKN